MSFPYKLVAFDLDGTLAGSKEDITPEMAELLRQLSLQTKVVVISGGSFLRFQEQILRSLIPSENIILLPVEGSKRYEYDTVTKDWKMTDRQAFPEKLKKEAIDVLNEIIASGEYGIPALPTGTYIEDRDTEIAFSALGQEADLAKKEAWDPDRTKRFKIKKAIEEKVNGLMVVVAGTTSIDILPAGFDKAKGLGILLEKLKIDQKDVLFVGDAIVPGGNDYAVFEAGIKSIKVSGPKHTSEVIRKILDEGNGKSPLPTFPKDPVAYFCSEYAFDANNTQYAGGLGILAGDYVLEAADQNISFVAIGLHYGNVAPDGFEILHDVLIDVPIATEIVKAKVWHRAYSPNTHVFLLGSDPLTAHLYDQDFYIRIKQQMVLGIGGIRLLARLGISPRIYHLNEGHTAFAAIAMTVEKPSELGKIVATKHTILSAAGLQITCADLEKLIGPYCKELGIPFAKVFEKGKFELSTDFFSTTKMIMASAVRANAVSAIHAVFEKKVHPHSKLISVTNGVYRKRWQASDFFSRPVDISDRQFWNMKGKLRAELCDHIESVSGRRFDSDICTLVWARRLAHYKRPGLLFTDLERVAALLTNPNLPLQCVISGKAHPGDVEGEEIRKKIIAFSNRSDVKGKIVYIPDYSIESAGKLTRGADIWLNTPELGKEACGTSGIKASLNGALQCSVRDGWVDEVNWEGMGWTLPGDAEKNDTDTTAEILYDLLEYEILPCFYDSQEEIPKNWVSRMRSTIDMAETKFTSLRMLHDYEERLYRG